MNLKGLDKAIDKGFESLSQLGSEIIEDSKMDEN